MNLMQHCISQEKEKIMIHDKFYSSFSLLIVCAFILLSSYTKAAPVSDLYKISGNDTTKTFVSLLANIPANKNNLLFDFNPQVMPFVKDFIGKQNNYYEKMKVWATPYFNLYERILTQWGLPVELKYLSVIESSLRSNIASWAGAVGPWQIMPETARRFGLSVGRGYDERTDFYKSTQAASKYLKELHAEFGDWLLVVAAYNVGEGVVRSAVRKAGSNDFWVLQYYLPTETRNHVKKFIATHYFFEGKNNGDTKPEALTVDFAGNPSSTPENTDYIEISGKFNSVVLANSLIMDITNFNQLNPHFDDNLSKGYSYTLRLPVDKMEIFKARKLSILKESVDLLLSSANGAK
jgi:membrane-bound lytic murein transglycosylase D